MRPIQYLRRFVPKTISGFLTVLAALVIIVGCAEKTATDTIVIRGSNTFGEELAPQLVNEFQKEKPGVKFDMEFKGTPYGLGALMAQRCDIGAASREVTPHEISLSKDNGVELKDYVIGSYSVAVVANSANQVANLNTNQVRDIFTGVITNWSEVGGADAAIHLYIRNPISGTYLGFQEIAMEKKPYGMGLKAVMTDAQILGAVAKDPNGIGYSGIDFANKANVKAVTIQGVAPTLETINKGSYPYARVLRLYTNKTKESPITTEFIQFIESAKGQKILEQLGFVPKGEKKGQ
jgi:phosphate transport system substrate-binding protein